MKKYVVAIAVVWLHASTIAKEDEVVDYAYLDLNLSKQTVEARLRVPDKPNGHALVILHHAGGWGANTTDQYAKFFNERGYITLEPRMFNFRGGIKNTLEHTGQAMGALQFLAQRPDVDPAKIDVMGLSYGSYLTTYATTEWVTQRFSQGKYRFRKAAALYPVCWSMDAIARGTVPGWLKKNSNFPPFPDGFFNSLNGTVLRFFVAGEDEYDDKDTGTCQHLIDAITDPRVKSLMSVKIYPGVTHAWDQNRNETWYERIGCKGRGCDIKARHDQQQTDLAMKELVNFFEN